MIRLAKEQVIRIHSSLITETGGSDGVRDDEMLDSALNAPFQTFNGKELYPALLQKAARLCFYLINNHPFVDGNKRIGIHTMLVFLALNGIDIKCSQDELVKIGLSLADGSMKCEELFEWLENHN